MHDGIDSALRQEARTQRVVAPIAPHPPPWGSRLPEAAAQVVEDDDVFARLAQLTYHVAADVAGTAGDQNRSCGQSKLPACRLGIKAALPRHAVETRRRCSRCPSRAES